MVTTSQIHTPAARLCVLKGTTELGYRPWLDVGKLHFLLHEVELIGGRAYVCILMITIIYKASLTILEKKEQPNRIPEIKKMLCVIKYHASDPHKTQCLSLNLMANATNINCISLAWGRCEDPCTVPSVKSCCAMISALGTEDSQGLCVNA